MEAEKEFSWPNMQCRTRLVKIMVDHSIFSGLGQPRSCAFFLSVIGLISVANTSAESTHDI